MTRIAAFVCGALFGLGLALSGMTDPARVQGFLDFAGAWDPTLAFVMGSALATTAAGYRLVRARGRPLFAPGFAWPQRSELDLPLFAGAVLFGVGWGLVGLCPGPALASLARGSFELYVFVAAMLAGAAAQRWLPAPTRG